MVRNSPELSVAYDTLKQNKFSESLHFATSSVMLSSWKQLKRCMEHPTRSISPVMLLATGKWGKRCIVYKIVYIFFVMLWKGEACMKACRLSKILQNVLLYSPAKTFNSNKFVIITVLFIMFGLKRGNHFFIFFWKDFRYLLFDVWFIKSVPSFVCYKIPQHGLFLLKL